MAGLVGGNCVMEGIVPGMGGVVVVWVVIMLVVVVVVVNMVREVDMDARLGHCSAATRDGQRHISRLWD